MEAYMKRVIEEEQALSDKIHKLMSYIQATEMPLASLRLMQAQLSAMDAYKHILDVRIENYGMDENSNPITVKEMN